MNNNQPQIVLATKDGFNRYADFLVSQYIESGVGELEESKLETLLEIKYADVFSAVKVLGNGEVAKVRDLFLNFQKNLYLPHKEYQNVG
jgi:type I restriction enzyme R subunit